MLTCRVAPRALPGVFISVSSARELGEFAVMVEAYLFAPLIAATIVVQ